MLTHVLVRNPVVTAIVADHNAKIRRGIDEGSTSCSIFAFLLFLEDGITGRDALQRGRGLRPMAADLATIGEDARPVEFLETEAWTVGGGGRCGQCLE